MQLRVLSDTRLRWLCLVCRAAQAHNRPNARSHHQDAAHELVAFHASRQLLQLSKGSSVGNDRLGEKARSCRTPAPEVQPALPRSTRAACAARLLRALGRTQCAAARAWRARAWRSLTGTFARLHNDS